MALTVNAFHGLCR